jgi:glycosyltransferase involved in cell wall biosynthesis
VQLTALACGSAFVCASERQRDLWLGALASLGRIDLAGYRADPTLRNLIDVVPFGLEPEPPRRTAPAIKGVVPGIAEKDKVLLWAGGIWNWFDPATVIRAVAAVAARRDDVRLFFLAPGSLEEGPREMEMAREARRLADELALTGRVVFFNNRWVPYAERANYLLDADVGVSAHFDTVESRFAFRTRLLDHFWAGLPSIVTGGDALAELVERRELGAVVAAGDVDAWSRAIEDLLADDVRRERARASCAAVRDELAWPVVTEPLARLVETETAHTPARAAGARLTLDYVGRGLVAAAKNRRLAAEWWRTRRGA